jgi:hypothetical protein
MYRNYSHVIGASGTGSIDIQHGNAAVEWDIYQISTQCGAINASCIVILYVNSNFLCATPQGSLDCATGPPDVILNATDILTAAWQGGMPGDPINVGIWYNENAVGGTYSTAH